MTTGRINQVTAFHCAHGGWLKMHTASSPPTPPAAQDGTCLARPNGTALVTALGLDFALLCTEQHTPVCNPFTHTFSSAWSSSLDNTRCVTAATNSSLGRLADPGLFRLHSTLLPQARESTGATPLHPRFAPVPCEDGT